MDKKFRTILSVFIITMGSIMASLALQLILIPNQMIDGGVNGIAIILNKVFGGSLSLFVLCLNIPFAFICYKFLGKKTLCKMVYAMVLFSLFLEIFSHFDALISDTLLATVYGGILLGVGVGLVIKEGGCLDGSEMLAILISRNNSLSIGQVVFFFNIFVYGMALFVFGVERALYSLLTYFVTYKVIDMVSDGLNSAKAVFIITDDCEEIAGMVLSKLGRTATIINGRGIVSNENKDVLYTVITRFEISMLKDILNEAKASSFVTIFDVSEIIGNHIKKVPLK